MNQMRRNEKARLLEMKFKLMAAVTMSVCLAWAEDVPFMPCPDCGREVSKRALMCPNCGLKGEIIEQAAKELAERIKPKELDGCVIANFGKGTCRALPVKMSDGNFIMLPLEKTFGLETLIFTYVSTNIAIGYGVPEVALDPSFSSISIATSGEKKSLSPFKWFLK